MGTRIKFRGQYEPYVITGARPYGPSPRIARKKRPKQGRRFFCTEDGLICSSCSLPIRLGATMFITAKGTTRHSQC